MPNDEVVGGSMSFKSEMAFYNTCTVYRSDYNGQPSADQINNIATHFLVLSDIFQIKD